MLNPGTLSRSSFPVQAVSAEERLHLFLVVYAVLESSLGHRDPDIDEAEVGEFG